MPLAEKKKLADAVIDNNGSLEQTRTTTEAFLSEWGYLKKREA